MSEGIVEAIYIAPQGGAAMERRDAVRAVQGEGLEDDRYRVAAGTWSRGARDVCQMTLIRGEDLDAIERETGIRVLAGQHRRNVVTRGVDLAVLTRGPFRIGATVTVAYERPRPPCRHLANVTEPGMTEALRGRSGICARILTSGPIREGDAIALVSA